MEDWHQPPPRKKSKTLNKPKRFFLDCDNDSHYYIIPAEKRVQWEKFLNIDDYNPACMETPEWAKPIGGGFNTVTFENPKEK